MAEDGDGYDGERGRLRRQMAVGKPQTIEPRPCRVCGVKVVIVRKPGGGATFLDELVPRDLRQFNIEYHIDPATQRECEASGKSAV